MSMVESILDALKNPRDGNSPLDDTTDKTLLTCTNLDFHHRKFYLENLVIANFSGAVIHVTLYDGASSGAKVKGKFVVPAGDTLPLSFTGNGHLSGLVFETSVVAVIDTGNANNHITISGYEL